jgi:hypothetical protein
MWRTGLQQLLPELHAFEPLRRIGAVDSGPQLTACLWTTQRTNAARIR